MNFYGITFSFAVIYNVKGECFNVESKKRKKKLGKPKGMKKRKLTEEYVDMTQDYATG